MDTQPNTEQVIDHIRGLIQSKANAYRLRRSDKLVKLYLDDDRESIVYDVMAIRYRGIAQNEIAATQFIDSAIGPLVIDYDVPEVYCCGETAISHSILKIDLEMVGGGRVYTLCRQTDVWKLIEGQWQIVVEMNSGPMLAVETREFLGELPGMPSPS